MIINRGGDSYTIKPHELIKLNQDLLNGNDTILILKDLDSMFREEIEFSKLKSVLKSNKQNNGSKYIMHHVAKTLTKKLKRESIPIGLVPDQSLYS